MIHYQQAYNTSEENPWQPYRTVRPPTSSLPISCKHPRQPRRALARHTGLDARNNRLNTQHERGTWDPTAEEIETLDILEAAYKALPQDERYDSEAFKAHCNLQSVIMGRPLKIAQAAEDVAFDAMKALYDSAKAQRFYTPCRHCEYSATRELIAMNMD